MELKLKDLRYLVAVADHRHFGRAAARCFVSQPTLSAQLKKLEQALGVQLIERAPNNVSLTAAGEEIVARARRVLEASDEVVALARRQRHPRAAHDTVRVADLRGETLLLLEDGHCLRDQALEVCSRAGVRDSQDFRATSLETLRQMVATGAGVTLLPELAGRGAYRNARGVVLRPFAKPAPQRRIGALWRKSTARRPAIDALAKLITEHAL